MQRSLGRTGRRKPAGKRSMGKPIGSSVFVAALVAALLCAVGAQSASAHPGLGYGLHPASKPSKTAPYTPCPRGGRMIECNIVVDPPPAKTSAGFRLPGGGPLLEGGGELGGYDPEDLLSAYKIPSSGGKEETVALVDAYGYAAAEADLAKYREKYGLSACTTANGCFKKVNQKGEEKNYPKEGGGLEAAWSFESALDLDMVSAVCPECHITLVEATTQEPKDTAASAEEAATLGATEISNSYGYAENEETYCPAKKGCSEYLAAYNHAGIPVTVSTGDSGYNGGVGAPSWPATSPNVIAVGGTGLFRVEGGRGWAEAAWQGGGSGCSLYETKPAWQTDPSCSNRMDSDVSAVASPGTPVSVYNTPYQSGWGLVGGTSVSSPLVAAIEAHSNSATRTAGAEAFYKHPGMLNDITEGTNGFCTPPTEDAYFCTAGPGYDGPTGWGTPNGPPRLTGWFTRGVTNLSAKVNAKAASLSSVSCIGSASCFAAGHFTTSSGREEILIDHRNGTEWLATTPEPPRPPGAKSASLTGISCAQGPFVETCDVVGHAINGAGKEVVVGERVEFGRTNWVYESLPNPAGATSSTLSSVSCPSSNMCMAVGHYVNSENKEVALAEEYQYPGPWTIKTAVLPEGAKSATLLGVSCGELTEGKPACDAVGHYVTGAGVEQLLAERFNGTEWVLRESATPEGAKSSSLSSISCAVVLSTDTCHSAGHYVNGTGTELTLEEHYLVPNKPGTITATPNPTGAKSSSIGGISCIGAEACEMVGHYVNSESKELTLAEVYTAASKKWVIQETPNPTGAKSSSLGAVACATTEACQAVGHYVNSESKELTLAEGWASSKWTVGETPVPSFIETTGSLPGVSCTLTEACTAVGHHLNSSGTEVTLAERWNGKEWSSQETLNPTGAKGSTLTGVSCASATACTAVGHYINSEGKELALAEVWASSKWTIKEPLLPTGAKSSHLVGVSCSAAGACTAVGHYVSSGSVELMLAERWNGTAWSIQETPAPTGAKSSSLLGVSCKSAEVCDAVGHYVNSESKELTLAEGWASAVWTVQESPNPAEAKSASLSGVSCASTTACTAVGHYVTSGGKEQTLAEAWASSKWTIKESPNPEGAKSSSLSGVSCAATTTCTAVGEYVNSGGLELTLAEAWASSKWTIQETLNPGEAEGSNLTGVSCHTAETCIATGRYLIFGGVNEVALVEEHA
ncbi:MAG TPA: S53 family peptidase [Solirubrobacteraceae bacterium]